MSGSSWLDIGFVLKRCPTCEVDGMFDAKDITCHQCGGLLILLEVIPADELAQLRAVQNVDFDTVHAAGKILKRLFESDRQYQFDGLEDYIIRQVIYALTEARRNAQ